MKKHTKPCLKCKKPVKVFQVEVAGSPYYIDVDPMPTLQGVVKVIDLVSNEAVITEAAPFQYTPHKCWEEPPSE
jgi:hypothetical protein